MPFAAALSTNAATEKALNEVCGRALEQLGARPDLALLFFSPHHLPAAADLASRAQERLGARCLLGCVGEAIVGNDREIEDGPAVSLWLGRWAQPVELEPFRMTLEQTPDGYSLLGWPDSLLNADPAQTVVLVLGDPFTFPIDGFLRLMNESHRGVRVVGGMAGAGQQPEETRLLLGGQAHGDGAVGVVLQGPVRVRSIVSQGCRPIGQPFVITKAQDNLIHELGGKSPRDRLQEVWDGLSPHDRALMRRGLHVGRVINEYQGTFRRGDFLVRNVLGLEQSSGALAITDRVRVGQTVQFHVRDAATADEDLHELLRLDLSAHEEKSRGALLFTCNGRGTRLFPEPDHDARVIRAEVGAIPVAGFFAHGELGPVGGQNFIHGFTASVVLFE
jgi:small ligand-binding sensory domain FIST